MKSHVNVRSVRRYLENHRHEMVRLLEKLVRAESPSTVPEAQTPILEMLKTEFARVGADAKVIPGEGSGGHLLAVADGEVLRDTQRLIGTATRCGRLEPSRRCPLSARMDDSPVPASST